MEVIEDTEAVEVIEATSLQYLVLIFGEIMTLLIHSEIYGPLVRSSYALVMKCSAHYFHNVAGKKSVRF